MSKKRLSQQQHRRIKANQHARRHTSVHEGDLQPAQEGLVITHFGGNVEVENVHEERFICHVRQNLPAIVVGDRVTFHPRADDNGVIVAQHPRKTELIRFQFHGDARPMAANVTQIIIVICPEPAPNDTTLDRYLLAAEVANLKPLIFINKSDLDTLPAYERIQEMRPIYEKLGYTILEGNKNTGDGLSELQDALVNEVSIFAGQSGVGKSSLIKQLIPEENIKIGDISEQTRFGRHTTTASRLYHLPDGGDLIDSPGIRQYHLDLKDPNDIIEGFIELKPLKQSCKYRNCTHEHEPGCALIAAVKAGDVSEHRMNAFLKLCAPR